MASAAYRRPAQGEEKRKLGPLALTVALHAIIVLLLFLHRDFVPVGQVQESLKTFFLPAGRDERAEHGDASKRPHETRAGKEAQAEKPVPKVRPPVTPPPVRVPEAPVVPSLLTMSSADYAATDISGIKSSREPAGDQGNSVATYGPGEGPGGAILYNPDWYRRPTNAELAFYLPERRPARGWGLIACKTVEHFHVDDCQTLGEFPLGSGFGRAVREAAWQFLVRPPRINGRPQIGAWVRIRITYGEVAEPE